MWQILGDIAIAAGSGAVTGLVALGVIRTRLDWIFAEVKQVRADMKELRSVARRAHERIDRMAEMGRMQ